MQESRATSSRTGGEGGACLNKDAKLKLCLYIFFSGAALIFDSWKIISPNIYGVSDEQFLKCLELNSIEFSDTHIYWK